MSLIKQYPKSEVLERLLELMKGVDLADDTLGLYGGKPWNETLSEILELCQNSYPSVTGVFPYGLHAQTENIEDAHIVLHAGNSDLDKRDHRWVSGTFTVLTTDEVILCGIGAFTGTMYTAIGNAGRTVDIKNAGTGAVQINGFGSQTIDGGSLSLAADAAGTLFVDGTNWYIL